MTAPQLDSSSWVEDVRGAGSATIAASWASTCARRWPGGRGRPGYVDRLVELGILRPGTPDEFSQGDVLRARWVQSLERAGVPLDGMAAAVQDWRARRAQEEGRADRLGRGQGLRAEEDDARHLPPESRQRMCGS